MEASELMNHWIAVIHDKILAKLPSLKKSSLSLDNFSAWIDILNEVKFNQFISQMRMQKPEFIQILIRALDFPPYVGNTYGLMFVKGRFKIKNMIPQQLASNKTSRVASTMTNSNQMNTNEKDEEVVHHDLNYFHKSSFESVKTLYLVYDWLEESVRLWTECILDSTQDDKLWSHKYGKQWSFGANSSSHLVNQQHHEFPVKFITQPGLIVAIHRPGYVKHDRYSTSVLSILELDCRFMLITSERDGQSVIKIVTSSTAGSVSSNRNNALQITSSNAVHYVPFDDSGSGSVREDSIGATTVEDGSPNELHSTQQLDGDTDSTKQLQQQRLKQQSAVERNLQLQLVAEPRAATVTGGKDRHFNNLTEVEFPTIYNKHYTISIDSRLLTFHAVNDTDGDDAESMNSKQIDFTTASKHNSDHNNTNMYNMF